MIRLFFGDCGSGKTSLAVRLMYKQSRCRKKKKIYDYIYSNIGDTISLPLDVRLLSDYKPPKRSYLVIDESGIEFNSRRFKSFDIGFIEFFKKHRHESCDIDFFSQSWDDTDKIIRDLSAQYWHVTRFWFLTVCRRYFKRIEIDKNTHQIITGFYTRRVLWQLLPFQPKQFMFCFRPKYYKFFNSFSPIDRPVLTDLSSFPKKNISDRPLF